MSKVPRIRKHATYQTRSVAPYQYIVPICEMGNEYNWALES